MSCPACLFLQPRAPCPGMAPPTVNWVLLYRSSVKKMSHRRASMIEAPSQLKSLFPCDSMLCQVNKSGSLSTWCVSTLLLNYKPSFLFYAQVLMLIITCYLSIQYQIRMFLLVRAFKLLICLQVNLSLNRWLANTFSLLLYRTQIANKCVQQRPPVCKEGTELGWRWLR